MRKDETHGVDYYFFSADEFRKRVNEDEFVEWEEVYAGQMYGTLLSEVDRIWRKGHHVIFDVDVKGGLNLKKKFGLEALAIFVRPPSMEALEERLRSRATEPEEKIKIRLAKASSELSYESRFDFVLVNDDLERAVAEAHKTINKFLGIENGVGRDILSSGLAVLSDLTVGFESFAITKAGYRSIVESVGRAVLGDAGVLLPTPTQ